VYGGAVRVEECSAHVRRGKIGDGWRRTERRGRWEEAGEGGREPRGQGGEGLRRRGERGGMPVGAGVLCNRYRRGRGRGRVGWRGKEEHGQGHWGHRHGELGVKIEAQVRDVIVCVLVLLVVYWRGVVWHYAALNWFILVLIPEVIRHQAALMWVLVFLEVVWHDAALKGLVRVQVDRSRRKR
jgi:hypothetical protein